MIDPLCAQLTGTMADKFYMEFNLISSGFSEYDFNERKDIFYLPGNVAKKAADEFYKEFNLISSGFSE